MRRFVSFVLSLITVIGISAPAYAEDSVNEDSLQSEITTNYEVQRVDASNLHTDILAALTKEGVTINDQTSIEVISINSQNDKGICITNQINDSQVRDIIIAYAENESGNLQIDNTLATAIVTPLGSKEFDWSHSFTDNGLVFHGTIYENQFLSSVTCVQPYRLQFGYTASGSVNLDRYMVNFVTGGYLYTQSDFTFVPNPNYPVGSPAADATPYRFTIASTIVTPKSGETYSVSNDSLVQHGWIMDLSTDFSSQFIEITMVINGETLPTEYIDLSRFTN